MRRLHAGVCLISRVSGILATLLLVLAVLVVCQMVFVRAVLGGSSIWQTEFVTFSIVAATFLGAPYILLTHGHVNVDLLPLMLDDTWRRRLALLASALALTFCALFLYSAIHWWWEAWTLGLTTSSIWRARLWIPYLSVPVGMLLLCAQYIVDIWALMIGEASPFVMEIKETV